MLRTLLVFALLCSGNRATAQEPPPPASAGPGWTTGPFCWQIPLNEDPCRRHLHPHLSDLGISGQKQCTAYLPQFGELGTTLRLWAHFERCKIGSTLVPAGSICVFLASLMPEIPAIRNENGRLFVSLDPQHFLGAWRRTATAQGQALLEIQLPSDPAFIGLTTYWQAVFIEPGGIINETSPGTLELY